MDPKARHLSTAVERPTEPKNIKNNKHETSSLETGSVPLEETEQASSSNSTPENLSVENLKKEMKEISDDGDFPDGGWGWAVCFCAFLINTFSWGINSSFGVFLNIYLETDKYPGSTALDFAFIGGLTFGFGLFMSPFITTIVKYIGCRPTIILGTTFQCLGLICASFTKEYWQLLLSQGIFQGIGLGMVFFPPSAVIPQWFSKYRALATGIATAGTGMGGIIFSLSVQRMVEYMSIEWIQRFCGLLCFAVCLCCSYFIKTRTDIPQPKMDFLDKQAFNKVAVYTLLAWGFLTMMAYEIFLFSMANFATSIGLTSQQGSTVGALLNAGVVIGRPFLGILMDKFGRFNFTLLSTTISVILCFAMWIPCDNYATAIALALLAGTQVSGTTVAIPPLAAELVGIKHFPPLLAAAWMIMGIACVIGEPIAQILADDTLSSPFLYCQIFTGLAFFVGALVILFTRQRVVRDTLIKRQQEQMEKLDVDEKESEVNEAHLPGFFKRLLYPMKV